MKSQVSFSLNNNNNNNNNNYNNDNNKNRMSSATNLQKEEKEKTRCIFRYKLLVSVFDCSILFEHFFFIFCPTHMLTVDLTQQAHKGRNNVQC